MCPRRVVPAHRVPIRNNPQIFIPTPSVEVKLNRCQGDGASVWDTPALDSKGRLYDVSTAGIFQMVPGAHGWSFKVIYSGDDGRSGSAMPPYNDPEAGDLLLDVAGNLYGTFGVGKNYNGGVGELSLARTVGKRTIFTISASTRATAYAWTGRTPNTA